MCENQSLTVLTSKQTISVNFLSCYYKKLTLGVYYCTEQRCRQPGLPSHVALFTVIVTNLMDLKLWKARSSQARLIIILEIKYNKTSQIFRAFRVFFFIKTCLNSFMSVFQSSIILNNLGKKEILCRHWFVQV